MQPSQLGSLTAPSSEALPLQVRKRANSETQHKTKKKEPKFGTARTPIIKTTNIYILFLFLGFVVTYPMCRLKFY